MVNDNSDSEQALPWFTVKHCHCKLRVVVVEHMRVTPILFDVKVGDETFVTNHKQTYFTWERFMCHHRDSNKTIMELLRHYGAVEENGWYRGADPAIGKNQFVSSITNHRLQMEHWITEQANVGRIGYIKLIAI